MITIPEPCQEDFSKMTPTERGVFCTKCKIDTYDFREKTDAEVAKVFLENKGKHICGQFSNRQLDDMNHNFIAWKNQNSKTFRSKFLFALLLVFGLSLFSCDSEEKKQMTDLVELVSIDRAEQNYVSAKLTTDEEMTFDLRDYARESNESTPPPPPEVVCRKFDTDDYTGVEDEFPMEQFVTAGVPQMLGGAMVAESYEYMQVLVDSSDEKITLSPETIDPNQFEAIAFPNPTRGMTNVQLDVTQTGQFEVSLYNMGGALIQSIFSGELIEGRQQFEVDLQNQETGMYLITVQSGEQMETLKVQRL